MSDTITYMKAENGQVTVAVDSFDDDNLWLSICGNYGGSHCVISFEEAKKMVEALKRIMEQS